MPNDLEANADSVNFLITELCRALGKQQDDATAAAAAAVVSSDSLDQRRRTAVAKMRAKSFEILLKKSPRPHAYTSIKEQDAFEPQRAFDVQIFAAKLNSSANPKECARFAEFEPQLEALWQEPYFTRGAGRGVLQLLLALQGNVPDVIGRGGERLPRAPLLLVPGPFTLHANYENNRYYPAVTAASTESVLQPAPRFFKGVQEIKSRDNPYLPKFLFDGIDNKLLQIEQKFATDINGDGRTPPAEDCTFTSMSRRLWGDSMRVGVRAFRLFPESGAAGPDGKLDSNRTGRNAQQQTGRLPTAAAPKTKSPAPPPSSSSSLEMPRIFSWNWEQLDCFGISCARPFASEADVTLELQSYHNQMHNLLPFEANILTAQQFLQDLKSLTVGIQSDTFQHDEYIIFSMQKNVTISGVLPATISHYVVDFLECGTCYKRLQTMIMKRDYKLMFEGFMFRALCSAIDEYLLTFRQFVFAKTDQHLMGFYKRMKKMMNHISNLSFTLAIHPQVDVSVKPPMGSQFLGYLYREIMRLTEKDYITLLVFILKRCCHVYFKHLQKWIFYGILDDPSNELFVCFVDHYRQNTKYFYDKAYFVRKESVPGFFQNFEDQILQCGKYTMLLKAYKPNHPLFDLAYPAISVCLSFDEIRKLELNCAKYYERARELCGKSITMRDVFEKRADQKRHFHQMVSQRSRANMERWTDEQHALALIAAEQKKKRLEELTAQLQDAKQRKIDERRANVEYELRLLREAEKLEEQRLLRENINLRKRIEYYQEVSDQMQCDAQEQAQYKQKLIPSSSSSSTPPASSKQQSPQTPTSATGTDFESCYGEDEDARSEYAECISDEFLQRFEENERELQALCRRSAAGSSENHNVNAAEAARSIEAKAVASDTSVSTATTLKRSASDVINSNEELRLSPTPLSAMQINRQNATSGANMELCVRTANSVELRAAGKLATPPPLLTEAQRNKLKVLTQEFGMRRGDQAQTKSLPADINLNTLPDSELSALQLNRRRMMQNDTFGEYNKHPLASRAKLNLDLNTDRARNRQKVLESEFHILTGQVTSSVTTFTVDVAPPPPTPMSTTSDTPTAEYPPGEQASEDLTNGNLAAKSTLLKIDVKLAQGQSIDQLQVVQTAATQPEVTPDCALNTAGLRAKKGFDFADKHERRSTKKPQTPIKNDSLLPDDDQEDDGTDQLDAYSSSVDSSSSSDPYRRCRELLQSNFKCPPRSPYIRLNLPPSAAAVADAATLDMRKSSESFGHLKLNSMSVITLTEFLQKSVIMPMSIHLELVTNEVMRMFLEDLRILEHLRSLRHYFFMMDGEFGSIICDGIIGKLEDGATPEQLLNYQMLHAILDTALGSSMTGKEKNAENLSFIVSDVPATFDLGSPGVLSTLSLSYRIEWPLNLILNPETLEQYANIFKYLIKVRRISWILERAYQMLKEAVKKHGKQLLQSPQYRHVQQIRHKFYHFVHALQNHITANALQASWKTFKDELLQAKSMEDIYRKHTIYVKRILFLCMLNRRSVEFFNTIENIFKISLRFFNNLKSREFKIRPGDEHFTHTRYEKLASDELEFDKFIKYTIYLGEKIVRHGYQAEIGEFISLINYNQYYMKKST